MVSKIVLHGDGWEAEYVPPTRDFPEAELNTIAVKALRLKSAPVGERSCHTWKALVDAISAQDAADAKAAKEKENEI